MRERYIYVVLILFLSFFSIYLYEENKMILFEAKAYRIASKICSKQLLACMNKSEDLERLVDMINESLEMCRRKASYYGFELEKCYYRLSR